MTLVGNTDAVSCARPWLCWYRIFLNKNKIFHVNADTFRVPIVNQLIDLRKFNSCNRENCYDLIIFSFYICTNYIYSAEINKINCWCCVVRQVQRRRKVRTPYKNNWNSIKIFLKMPLFSVETLTWKWTANKLFSLTVNHLLEIK